MRAGIVVAAALAAASLAGCTITTRRSSGGGTVTETSVVASPVIGVEENFVYFPSHHAYYSDTTHVWWVVNTGVWVETRERPQRIVIRDETPWVVVNVRGPRHHDRFEAHAREYPETWTSKDHKGPPPGRGWKR